MTKPSAAFFSSSLSGWPMTAFELDFVSHVVYLLSRSRVTDLGPAAAPSCSTSFRLSFAGEAAFLFVDADEERVDSRERGELHPPGWSPQGVCKRCGNRP